MKQVHMIPDSIARAIMPDNLSADTDYERHGYAGYGYLSAHGRYSDSQIAAH